MIHNESKNIFYNIKFNEINFMTKVMFLPCILLYATYDI